MDDCDAVDAAVGSHGLDLHMGLALGLGSDCRSSEFERCGGIPGGIPRAANCDDVADWCRGHEAERLVEENAADSTVGRFCILYLAGQLRAQNDSMARYRLFPSRRPTRSR